MCDYEIEYFDSKEKKSVLYRCPYQNYEYDEIDSKWYCIFHCKRDDKDIKKFYNDFKFIYEKGNHSFIGFIFPNGFNFKKLKVEMGSLKFKNAIFYESLFKNAVSFDKAEFFGDDGTNFEKAKFTGDDVVSFHSSVFMGLGGVNFSQVKFLNKYGAHFRKTQFLCQGVVNFSGTLFNNDIGADFSDSIFLGNYGVDFYNAKFSGKGKVDFSKSEIKNGLNLTNTEFKCRDGVIFKNAKFIEGKVNFRSVKFFSKKGVDFSNSQFLTSDGIYFSNVDFLSNSTIDFSGAKFSDKASFENTTFFNEKEFLGNKNTIDFGKASFENNIIFRNTKFDTSVSFKHSIFKEDVEFIGNNKTEKIEENHIFSDKHHVDFRDVTFEKPEKVIFNMVNLSRARFLNTDISKVRLIEVDWKGKEDKKDFSIVDRIKDFFKLKRLKLYDEEFADEENTHYQVDYLYKQLRLNYENTGRNQEAGDFFLGEMERRRKWTGEGKFIKFLLFLYRHISAYGERPLKALICIFIFWVFFGLIYYLIGIDTINNPSNTFNNDFWNGLMVSLKTMTLGRVSLNYDVMSCKFVPIVKGVQTILSATFLSMFILAMNRKFRRKKD